MTVVADNVVLLRNIGVGSQLTSVKGTCTETVTGSPKAAVLGGFGVTVTTAPDTRLPVKKSLTIVVTPVVVAPSRTAARAPSRVALVMTCWTMTSLPYSIMPKMSSRSTGATMANSTTAAPRRYIRNDRKSLCTFLDAPVKDDAGWVLGRASPSFVTSPICFASRLIRAFLSTQSRGSCQWRWEFHRARAACGACARRQSPRAWQDRARGAPRERCTSTDGSACATGR